ncbi:MAG TPA: glycosyltransferase family 2 protein [Chryseolinea sp.]|nr:glycosyltransferase family 2 protein [Chryseolinea sp.]
MIKVSIVMATYNAAKYLSTALDSIISQQYPAVDIVIIDGKSKDNTVEIIKKYESHIGFWISEPDKGIYDAWNKGVKNAKGDWIMFLGSDDYLLPGALRAYSDFISQLDRDVEFVSSKVQLTDINLVPYRVAGWHWEWPRFQHVNTIAHPGSLHSRHLFERFGYFNVDYKIVGDYEFLLRGRSNLKAAFMDKLTVMFREGGVSDGYGAIRESFKASIRTGKAPVATMLWHAGVANLKYFVRKLLLRFNIKAQGRKQYA